MNKEFTTPIKSENNSASPTPDTVKHIKQTSIFSNSAQKSHASPISENRYKSQDSNLFDKTFEEKSDSEECSNNAHNENQVKPVKKVRDNVLVKNLNFTEKLKKECAKEEETSGRKEPEKKVNFHLRNVSDADSVVYIGSDDERHFHDFKISPFVLGDAQNRESLMVLDNAPCTAYCRYCKVDVHTSVEFYNTKLSKGLMKVVSSIFACCSLPTWINTLRVHKCPYCSLVIAKCR